MSAQPPAGWYADPEIAAGQRYWDGSQWTPHRAPPVGQTTKRSRTLPKTVWALMAIALVLLMGKAVVAVGETALTSSPTPSRPAVGSPTSPAPVPTPTGSVSAEPSASATSRAKAATPASPEPKAAAVPLVVVAGVVDGDTIKVSLGGTTERVRVIGIDTPELAQRQCFAQQAASKMQSLVQSKKVRLVADPTQADRDRYGRLLRHVNLADGRSVAQLLIAGGFGREYTYDRPYAGRTAYLAAQRSARSKHLGVWSSGCAPAAVPLVPAVPKPSPKPTPKPSPSACLIKGNIASDGERIYHVPGQQFYDVTKISTAKGERWFCTEREAVAAGWRRSKR